MNTKEKTKKIQELKKLLDWYIDCASDEEFDSNVVISLLHQLDALEPIAPEPMESVECPTTLQVKHYHRKSYLQSFLHPIS